MELFLSQKLALRKSSDNPDTTSFWERVRALPSFASYHQELQQFYKCTDSYSDMGAALNFLEIRREQRRVAALLQYKNVNVPVLKAKRQPISNIEALSKCYSKFGKHGISSQSDSDSHYFQSHSNKFSMVTCMCGFRLPKRSTVGSPASFHRKDDTCFIDTTTNIVRHSLECKEHLKSFSELPNPKFSQNSKAQDHQKLSHSHDGSLTSYKGNSFNYKNFQHEMSRSLDARLPPITERQSTPISARQKSPKVLPLIGHNRPMAGNSASGIDYENYLATLKYEHGVNPKPVGLMEKQELDWSAYDDDLGSWANRDGTHCFCEDRDIIVGSRCGTCGKPLDVLHNGSHRGRLSSKSMSRESSVLPPLVANRTMSSQRFQQSSEDSLVLAEIERKLKDGTYDFDSKVDISDVNTQIVFAEGDENGDNNVKKDDGKLESIGEKDDDDDALTVEKIQQRMIEDPAYRKKIGEIHREAYIQALSDARAKMLPKYPWMLDYRLTRPWAFSYFQTLPHVRECLCSTCSKERRKQTKQTKQIKMAKNQPRKSKKLNAMKAIFGKVKVSDYYPGGKKNPYLRNVGQRFAGKRRSDGVVIHDGSNPLNNKHNSGDKRQRKESNQLLSEDNVIQDGTNLSFRQNSTSSLSRRIALRE